MNIYKMRLNFKILIYLNIKYKNYSNGEKFRISIEIHNKNNYKEKYNYKILKKYDYKNILKLVDFYFQNENKIINSF